MKGIGRDCRTRIRNLTYRYLPDQTLFPTEKKQYDSYEIREALHNCITHQDYELHQRINVVEMPDELFSRRRNWLRDVFPTCISAENWPA